MYAVAILDGAALDGFRQEHPWLEFPLEIVEVSVYLDDSGAPMRLTALVGGGDSGTRQADVNSFGVDTILALVRHAPRGRTAVEDCPEENGVRTILESLPVADGTRPIEAVEAERKRLLEEAYDLLRIMTVNKFLQARDQVTDTDELERLDQSLASIPGYLADVSESSKSLFVEADLWRLAAVIYDEYHLPADHHLTIPVGDDEAADQTYAIIEANTMAYPLIQALFDLSPTAFSISTIGRKSSRYVRVNQAYLDLVGKTWDEIGGHEMVSSGVVTDDQAGRAERLGLLDSHGGYIGKIARIRDGRGGIITVSISARRLFLSGQVYDFEVLTPISD